MRCRLCPRECNALRTEKDPGYCKSPWQITAARASLHMWEEPVISGVRGSGTVFFSGCNLGCVFCQNQSIAMAKTALELSGDNLAEIFLDLQEKGAHNINLVTGSHYIPPIAKALRLAKDKGLTIPIVYNTSSYEKVETLKLLEGLVDIYLPDLKYYDPAIAARYSKAPDYLEYAFAAIKEMYRQVGGASFIWFDADKMVKECKAAGREVSAYYEEGGEETGLLMTKGVIIRHLLLPGALEDSKKVVKMIYETFGNEVYISLMNQYTPCNDLSEYPELKRTVSEQEYDILVDYAIDLGVENGFIQEGETNLESFIPAFDYSGLERFL